MYEELTNLIPFISPDVVGKWIPAADNNRKVKWIENSVNKFERKHDNPVFHHYDVILSKNGISWDSESLIHMDVSNLDGVVVLALLIGAVRSKPFGDKTVETLLKNGIIRRWLLRLKKIDFTDIRRDIYIISVSSKSGLVPAGKGYKDELRITENDIYYKYEPCTYSENNSYQVWSSKLTNSELYNELTEAVLTIIYSDELNWYIYDAGEISFSIECGNGIIVERTFWEPIKEFWKFFEIARKMLPPDEKTPKCFERYDKNLIKMFGSQPDITETF